MNVIRTILVALFGVSWKTTVCGLLEASAIQAFTYALNTEYHNPRVFWSGMGLSVVTVARGRLSKDHNVSNSPAPVEAAPVVNATPNPHNASNVPSLTP